MRRRGGDDTIFGYQDDDVLCGGDGDDVFRHVMATDEAEDFRVAAAFDVNTANWENTEYDRIVGFDPIEDTVTFFGDYFGTGWSGVSIGTTGDGSGPLLEALPAATVELVGVTGVGSEVVNDNVSQA